MRLLQTMRPVHWTKNMFVFAALVFGKKLIAPTDEAVVAIGSAFGCFICFCLAASAAYIFNDIMDRSADMLHPEKRDRPIAAGTVGIGPAALTAVLCAAAAVVGSRALSSSFTVIIIAYLALTTMYSLLLKQVMILDCIVISVGFCLRAIAGAVVIGVFISPWLIICTFALCLFLAFSKRRGELVKLEDNSGLFRKTLAGYNPELLAHMLDVTSGLAVVCFLLYATDERTLQTFGSNALVYTTPFVLYCIFRFSALIQNGTYHGPVDILLKDRPFQAGLLLWVLACIAIIYSQRLGLDFLNILTY